MADPFSYSVCGIRDEPAAGNSLVTIVMDTRESYFGNTSVRSRTRS